MDNVSICLTSKLEKIVVTFSSLFYRETFNIKIQIFLFPMQNTSGKKRGVVLPKTWETKGRQ